MERGIENYLQFLRGDQAAMRSIVELYWDMMLLFTNGYVHNLSAAEDIGDYAVYRKSYGTERKNEEGNDYGALTPCTQLFFTDCVLCGQSFSGCSVLTVEAYGFIHELIVNRLSCRLLRRRSLFRCGILL